MNDDDDGDYYDHDHDHDHDVIGVVRAAAIGMRRASWDGRCHGFWIGVSAMAGENVLSSWGLWWLGLAQLLAVTAYVYWRRPS